MRYIRKFIYQVTQFDDTTAQRSGITATSRMEEYTGPGMGRTWIDTNGYHEYAGNLPLSQLDITGGAVRDNHILYGGTIVELPAPEPSPELIAQQTIEELNRQNTVFLVPLEDDETAKKIAPLLRKDWTVGNTYKVKELVYWEGVTYKVLTEVLAQEHQKPGSVGMEAVYRAIDSEQHAGTLEDPIPWQYNSDVIRGLYYSHNGKIYKALLDQIPSLWEPGSVGTDALWELVSE